MRILTLEASVIELKNTGSDLRAKIQELEVSLDEKVAEVQEGLAREADLSREIQALKLSLEEQKQMIVIMVEQQQVAASHAKAELDAAQVLYPFILHPASGQNDLSLHCLDTCTHLDLVYPAGGDQHCQRRESCTSAAVGNRPFRAYHIQTARA
jgi:chromosome segregation ATPase